MPRSPLPNTITILFVSLDFSGVIWVDETGKAMIDHVNVLRASKLDVNRSEKIRMLIRLLEPFEEEVRRVLSDEEDNFANRSEASKETEAGQISKEAQDLLDRARSAIDNALYLMRVVVGDAAQ